MIVLNKEIIKSSYSLRTKSQGEPFKRDLCVLLFYRTRREIRIYWFQELIFNREYRFLSNLSLEMPCATMRSLILGFLCRNVVTPLCSQPPILMPRQTVSR